MKFNCLSNCCRSTFFFIILLQISIYQCAGQDVISKIDQKDLRKFIKTLTSVQFEGRAVDNNGQKKTQEFIIDRFKTLQLEPFSSGEYIEKFMLNQTDKGKIYLTTQNDRKLWNYDRMAYTGAIQPVEVIESEVVFGGYGTEEELNQIDVENRLVLVSLLIPSDEIIIAKRLEARKARGVVIFCKNDSPFEFTKNFYGDVHIRKRYSIAGRSSGTIEFDPQSTEIINSFPFISIMIPGAEVISMMGLSKKKLVDFANRKKINSVPPTKIDIHFEQIEKAIETANVIGVIKGESEQSIILSAHYDHMGKDGNRYYPGADDNASGVAALLELAEEFAQYGKLKYTMVFLAASAEESGLLGSFYHVNHPDFEPEKVICNINMDMISRCDGKQADCNYLYCMGDNQSIELDSLVREADKLFPNCSCDYSESNSDIFIRTDGYNFSKKGIPSLLFFAGLHDDYHKPTDTMEKINFDILENRILLISEVIKMLQITNE